MSAPDPKVVALTEAERSLASLACQVSPYGTSRWFPEAAVEQIIAAHIAAERERIAQAIEASRKDLVRTSLPASRQTTWERATSDALCLAQGIAREVS